MSTPDRPASADRLEKLDVRLDVISVVLDMAREELAEVRAAEATRTAKRSGGRRDRHGLRVV